MPEKDFSDYWLCPNDGSKMVEFIQRNDSGIFQIQRNKIELSVSNAIAVKKIRPDQKEEAIAIAQGLFASSEDPMIRLVSIICPICNYRSIAPEASKSRIEFKKGRKKQYKTVSQITKQAEKKRSQRSAQQPGTRFPIWYLFWIIPTILAFILGTLAYFDISIDKILEFFQF